MSQEMNPEMMENFKDNLSAMQEQMQSTYNELMDTRLKGYSDDKLVGIEMTATYKLVELDFDERALKGGLPSFKQRLTEAWDNLTKDIQGATQAQTMKLLNDMPVPEEIRQMSQENVLQQGQLEAPKEEDKG